MLSLGRNWWMVALRGLVAIAFGVLAIVFPHETVRTLLVLFGIFAIVDGVIAIADGFTLGRLIERTGLFLVIGLFSLVIGIITLVLPYVTLLALIYLIALRAILLGIDEIVLSVRLRDEIPYEWLLGISGFVSILFGLIVALAPLRSLVFFVLFIGVYAIFIGVTQLARAWDLRSTRQGDKQELYVVEEEATIEAPAP
jgi:uncharacterized membrane protein HdeD (DUF308 family)